MGYSMYYAKVEGGKGLADGDRGEIGRSYRDVDWGDCDDKDGALGGWWTVCRVEGIRHGEGRLDVLREGSVSMFDFGDCFSGLPSCLLDSHEKRYKSWRQIHHSGHGRFQLTKRCTWTRSLKITVVKLDTLFPQQ